MSTIPSVPPPTPTPAPAPAPAATATLVSAPPPQLANLPPNAVITATVTQVLPAGQVQLSTNLGPVTVRLPMTLTPGATLALQLTTLAPTPMLRVLSVNGQPLLAGPTLSGTLANPGLAGLLGPTPGNAGAVPATPAAGTGAPGVGASQGSGGPAVLEPDPSELAETGAGGIPATVLRGTSRALPTGAQLLLRVASVAPPAPGEAELEPFADARGLPAAESPAGAAVSTELARGDASNRAATSAATAAGEGDPPGSAPSGASIAGQSAELSSATTSPAPSSSGPSIPTPTPPLPVAPEPAQPAPPTSLQGTVAANSLAGRPLIQTPLGLIALETPVDLPSGARVTLDLVGATLPPAASPAAPASSGPLTSWPAVSDAVAALQKIDPAAAQLLIQRLPDLTLGPQFVPNVIAWVAAAQSGNVRAWLGDSTVKSLEKAGNAALVERIEEDVAGMRAPVTLPSGGSWQSFTLPLFFGQRVERIRLTVRRPPEDDEEAAGRDEEGLRFLVDVDMSRLGAIQLDGLVKRRAKRFDLIVRSKMGLPDEVRRDIGTIFNRALDGLGMTGGAIFKQVANFIEAVPAERAGAGLTI